MSAASNYLENKILDHVLTATAYTQPSRFLALYTASPGEAGAHTNEVSTSGTAYARQAVTFAAASSGSSATNATVTFPAATGAGFGLITHIAVVDSDTEGAGNVLFYGAVTTSKQIDAGDTFQITSGNLTISLD
jgi:hypothetical protein